MMKKLYMTAALFSCALFVGCEEGAYEQQADQIRATTQQQAEEIRESSQATAEQIRETSQEAAESARESSNVSEESAENIEDRGETKADRVEWAANGFAAIAFLLGANLLLRYLAETGKDSQLRAAVSISAPLDMETTSRNLRSGWNRLFDRYLLFRQRQEILRDNAELSAEERQTIANVHSVWDLDDQFTGPRFDFDGAAEYYQANSAIHVLEKICTPTLFFHALDDPVVDSDVFVSRNWEESGPLFPALADSGGHTGFLDQAGKRWHEYASVKFIDRVISKAISDNPDGLANQA